MTNGIEYSSCACLPSVCPFHVFSLTLLTWTVCTLIYSLWFFIHTCSSPWSCPFHPCTSLPVTCLLSPLYSVLYPTHLYPSPLYLLWHLRPFVLFCFNFPHTRKRKDITWHSVSQYLCAIVSSTSICFFCKWQGLILPSVWMALLCVCICPFICWRTPKLMP